MYRLKLISPVLLSLILIFSCGQKLQELPDNHLNLQKTASYAEMVEIIEQAAEKEHISFDIAGQSVQNRNLYLVHLNRGTDNNHQWRLFFYGQQHGNEPAGKDALIYLIRYIAENPQLLPDDVDLWIMPMVNPDGAEQNQRRNANNADLNRDHQLLQQPETRILHRVHREIMPHVAVDCHEFGRDSRSYLGKGWQEWPLIMMGCANNPLYDEDIYKNGKRWIKQVEDFMLERGHNYCRYYLGGTPPEDELRYSTPEADDARNGLGAYGGMSFIIESGRMTSAENPEADLGKRVDAYLDLLTRFIYDKKYRDADKNVIDRSRGRAMPPFIPVNYFWANKGVRYTDVRVIDKKTGQVEMTKTANFMHDLIVKKSVATPAGYVIDKAHVSGFDTLLQRHDIKYEILDKDMRMLVEPCRLIAVEEKHDPVYQRYSGRQIVEKTAADILRFTAGSIFVPLDQPAAMRAALLLEPTMLYGLYEFEKFNIRVDQNDILPVYRVIQNEARL